MAIYDDQKLLLGTLYNAEIGYGLFMTASDRTITFWSVNAERITGLCANEVTGKDVFFLLSAENRAHWQVHWEQVDRAVLDSGEPNRRNRDDVQILEEWACPNSTDEVPELQRPQVEAPARQRQRELAALARAIENRDFRLEYQPIVATENRRVIGMEALLRCTHPELVSYPIEGVIKLALDSQLFGDLSYWVLNEACVQMRKWKDIGFTGLVMSVNVCPQDLRHPDAPGRMNEIIRKTGLESKDVQIEITEQQALRAEQRGTASLGAFREKGIGIALDDFGTGFSALSYLRDLPVTKVKLDKSFLDQVPTDISRCAVVKAVIDLSKALGIEIIAEGVETHEQAAFLDRYSCTALQGYLISKPLQPEPMTTWLLSRRLERHWAGSAHRQQGSALHMGRRYFRPNHSRQRISRQ